MSLRNHHLDGGVSIDLAWLADDIADDLEVGEVLDFIAMIDGRMADVAFTTKLIRELQESLEEDS